MAVQNLFVSMLLGIPIGLVLAIPITPFVGLLRIMLLSPSKREKLRAQAEAKGHVVEAEMEKSYDDIRYDKVTGDQLPSNSIIGVYKYYVNGKKYKCKLSSTSRLSEKITLYYIKKPRHATTAGHLGNEELPWGKLYIYIGYCSINNYICNNRHNEWFEFLDRFSKKRRKFVTSWV